jgi:Secretion system C-terminal sorting domain
MEAPLISLVPNTTYFVDIYPDGESDPCFPYNIRKRQSFTTLPEDGEMRANGSATVLPDVSIAPNPATDMLRVSMQEGAYTTWRILHTNGMFIREGSLPAKGSLHHIPLRDLPDGMYILALLTSENAVQTKAFVVHRR